MPTPKQTRAHYKKCRRYFYLLLNALNDAHNAKVIDYEERYHDSKLVSSHPSVCTKIHEAKDNFETATKRQLANAMKEELMAEMKGVY